MYIPQKPRYLNILGGRFDVEGKHKLCTYGAGMAKSRWLPGTPSYVKTADISGSIFSSPVLENHRKTDKVLITPAAPEKNI